MGWTSNRSRPPSHPCVTRQPQIKLLDPNGKEWPTVNWLAKGAGPLAFSVLQKPQPYLESARTGIAYGGALGRRVATVVMRWVTGQERDGEFQGAVMSCSHRVFILYASSARACGLAAAVRM